MSSSGGNNSCGAEAPPSSPQLANVAKRARRSTATKAPEWKTVSPARLEPTTPEVANRMLPAFAVSRANPIPKAKVLANFQKKRKRSGKPDHRRRSGLFTRVSDEPLAEIDHAALETLRFPRCDARKCKRDCCDGAFSKLPLDKKRAYIAKVRQFYREQYSIGKSQQADAYLRQFIEPPALGDDWDGASKPPKIHAKFFLPSLKPNTRRICTSRPFWQSVFCLSRDKITRLVRSLVSGESMPPENRGGARFTKVEAKAVVVAALTEKLALAKGHNLRLQEGVCWADVWKLACKKLDEEFYYRCESAGYWPTFSKAARRPSDWPEDLAVPISYWSARKTMRLCNVREGSRAVDICEDCFQLQKKIEDAETLEAEQAAVEELEAHKKADADVSGDSSEGRKATKHQYELWVRKSYSGDQTWHRVPMLRHGRRKKNVMTAENC